MAGEREFHETTFDEIIKNTKAELARRGVDLDLPAPGSSDNGSRPVSSPRPRSKTRVEFDFGRGIVVPYRYDYVILARGNVSFLLVGSHTDDEVWFPGETKHPIRVRLKGEEVTVWQTGASFEKDGVHYAIFMIDPDADVPDWEEDDDDEDEDDDWEDDDDDYEPEPDPEEEEEEVEEELPLIAADEE